MEGVAYESEESEEEEDEDEEEDDDGEDEDEKMNELVNILNHCISVLFMQIRQFELKHFLVLSFLQSECYFICLLTCSVII